MPPYPFGACFASQSVSKFVLAKKKYVGKNLETIAPPPNKISRYATASVFLG